MNASNAMMRSGMNRRRPASPKRRVEDIWIKDCLWLFVCTAIVCFSRRDYGIRVPIVDLMVTPAFGLQHIQFNLAWASLGVILYSNSQPIARA